MALSAFGLLGSQNFQQAERIRILDRELQTSCAFFGDLGRVSIPAKPMPSKVAISLITDSIKAFNGRDCGRLGKVDPTLSKWQRYYHIKEAQ